MPIVVSCDSNDDDEYDTYEFNFSEENDSTGPEDEDVLATSLI